MMTMAERKGIENLRPIRDTETAKARGKLGGIKSGEAKREKKMVSQIYADFLADEFEISIDEEKKRFTGVSLVSETIKKILMRGDSSSASMLKEIREATEGSNINLSGTVTIIDDLK